MNAEGANRHIWHFFKTCGVDQVLFRNGADIAHLDELDQKIWTALSCPIQGVHFDARTLELLDADKDGRIRVPELLAAVKWCDARLTSLDPLLTDGDTLKLSDINAATDEGKALLANVKRILQNLGKGEAEAISLDDATDTVKIFAQTRFNGDGIITTATTSTPESAALIEAIIAAFGSETDRNGQPGVDQARVDSFFEAATAFIEWSAKPAADPAILPLGEKTEAAAAATAAVSAKIDDYFTRCSMAAFDARAAQALSRTDKDFAALADQELSAALPGIAAFPISKVEAYRDLPLQAEANPYWAEALALFHSAAAAPLLGAESRTLSAAQWHTIKARLAPFAEWTAAKAGGEVAELGLDKLKELVKGDLRRELTALIEQDSALADENAQIGEVECLLRYKTHLATLLRNYVNMAQLYDPKSTAIFQIGTLYMDARACELCFHVSDVGAHADLAAASKCCLAYCSITRPGTAETGTICAVFTAGFAQSLWVGRNGVFYDRAGRDWDAKIVKIVDNAISIKEAFWEPWRKIAGMIGAQVNKMLTARQDAALASAAAKVEATGAAVETPSPEAPKKMEGAALASSVAALGIAIGLVGSAVGGLVGLLAGLPLWKTCVGILAVILIVSGPSMIITAFKLRARDLAPILNACGWAVNRRLRLTFKLGRILTREATLPESAVRELNDPYADSHALRNLVIALLVIAALAAALWRFGALNSILPANWQHGCQEAAAPAAESPTPAADEAATDNG